MSKRYGNISRSVLLLTAGLLILVGVSTVSAQSFDYEEIVLRFEVPKLFREDILVQYDGENIFLPVSDIFRLLQINLETNYDKGRFEGIFLSNDNKYYIDFKNYEARCFGETHTLTNRDLIFDGSEVYLKIDMFDTIFRLKIHFSFSELSIYLPLDKSFPVYQELKRQAAHKRLKEEQAATRDIYELPYHREKFKSGVADWIATFNPLEKSGQYFGLSLGAIILGGDFSISGTGNSVTGFNTDQLRYSWHYAYKDSKYFTQADVGHIATTGSLARSLSGVMISNRPEIQRKYFKTINIDGQVGENWEVELYINNKLVDYTSTDQAGEYHFLVDIDYGTSNIVLQMYGPNGEIVTKEEDIKVPYNLIPHKAFEYNAAAGVYDSRYGKRKYAQGGIHYGILGNLTIGFETDVPIAVEDEEKPLYAATLTYQPLGNLLVNTSVSPENEASVSFNYTKQSMVNISGEYTKYYENQFRNQIGQLSSYAFSISSPLKFHGKYLNLRYRMSHSKFNGYNVTNMYYGFKLPILKMTLNYMGNYKISSYTRRSDKQISSQMFISTSFLKLIRPQFKINFDHDLNQISGYGVYLQRRIFSRGQLGLSFERNNLTGSNQIMLTFNIFNNFANFSTRAHFASNNTIITQSQRGSIRFDQNNKNFTFDRRNGVGLASAVVWPFHDENYNGVLDKGERLLPELKARIGGAQGRRKGGSNLYYYDGLRPYDDYLVQIDPYSLDDPTLQPSHDNYKVTISPNVVTTINVPIVTAGGISGSVVREIDGSTSGIGGTKVVVVNEVTGKEVVITTFNDGEFFYLGIVPGMYRIELDKEQLERYGYVADPPYINFQVKTVEGGDSVDDLNFTIRPDKK